MFISKLTRTIEAYDPYGIHRLNGTKVVYILLVLFVFNGIFSIKNPYFYFFYLPITALTAEVMMNTVEEKYKAYVYTMLGAAFMVLVFNMVRPYPLFFLIFAFFSTITLYLMALKRIPMMMPFVPIILSLAVYSLLYPTLNSSLILVLNNVLTILFALLIIIAALYLFPLSYYYRLWLRAFLLACNAITKQLATHLAGETNKTLLLKDEIKHMLLFSNMLPRHLPTHDVLKINLLIQTLYLKSEVKTSSLYHMKTEEIVALKQNLEALMLAIKTESPCHLTFEKDATFQNVIKTWNALCKKT